MFQTVIEVCRISCRQKQSGQARLPPLRSVRPAWFQPLRHYRGSGTSTLITPRRKTPCLPFRKSRRLLSALRLNARKDSGHCRKIGTVHRLSSSGRAVSVSQSLPGLRSCQSQPHGCCQRSGYAAVEPTRPAKFVLGGFATSYAPAFPSSCAAATAAAAAVRGSEVDYRCAATIDKTHRLRIFALYYSYTIGVLSISDSNTGRCQLSFCTAIPCIVDNETFFDSPLRGNLDLAVCKPSSD